MTEKILCVARITSAHGVKGLVKIQSFTTPEVKLFEHKHLMLKSGKEIKITLMHKANPNFICKIEHISNRDEAIKAKGEKIYIKRELLDAMEEDEFYSSDLIGLDVIDSQTNDTLGIVHNVYNFGAGDIIEVKYLNGKTEMLPFNKFTFPKVELENSKLFLNKV